MLTVAPDQDLVERQLGNGDLVCPRCEAGVLGEHGWVGRRWLRRADGLVVLLKAHATAEELAGGKVASGLRRSRCKRAECCSAPFFLSMWKGAGVIQRGHADPGLTAGVCFRVRRHREHGAARCRSQGCGRGRMGVYPMNGVSGGHG